MLEEQGLVQFFNERLQLNIAVPPRPKKFMWKWRDLADRHDNVRKSVEIALVGKYTQLEDAYASVTKALQHSALFVNRRLVLSVYWIALSIITLNCVSTLTDFLFRIL